MTVNANIWSINTNEPTQRNHVGWSRKWTDIAALYMTWRRLITEAVITSVNHVAVPASVTVASCDAPANMRLLLYPTAVGMADSVIATPSTNEKGIVGR